MSAAIKSGVIHPREVCELSGPWGQKEIPLPVKKSPWITVYLSFSEQLLCCIPEVSSLHGPEGSGVTDTQS
ncbi:hypothetical protein Y1Q_0006064 [Alligator mississippiensis]|uniref:Uncharacterized protein n=1 Tax=Alligator mississippiensis TaxID=8496 RepID=A0A151N3W7_ALLMI|nr:hypothetical protein Y1Q_0006064 [Alligator mississippiensis]